MVGFLLLTRMAFPDLSVNHRDIRWELGSDIVQEYISISRFQVSEMVKRMGRQINSETVRKMLIWSHFEFCQRLEHKANKFGSMVHEVSESYRSKSCGKCGRIHWKLER